MSPHGRLWVLQKSGDGATAFKNPQIVLGIHSRAQKNKKNKRKKQK
jgi:hypothetical protein